MSQTDRYEFLYFSQRKEDGFIEFHDPRDADDKVILPKHPETNELDKYYLRSALVSFDGDGDFQLNEILDAFPVLSLTTDENDKFYKLSIARLQEFCVGNVIEDDYIQLSIKHLFMKNQIVRDEDHNSLLEECMNKISPVMYEQRVGDRVDSENYELSSIASYVPTSKFRRMKILKGWIEGALHYYDYSIMFFDVRFVGYDDFNENIIDIKSKDLSKYGVSVNMRGPFLLHNSRLYYEADYSIYLNRDWLFTSPNNDNERDGKVMMFRNEKLRKVIEGSLTSVFRRGTYRLNDVLKWNRYVDGGKFNDHFDTMFVNRSTKECSMYTLLIYLEAENDDNLLFLGNDDVIVHLESYRAYIIPHWVKHHVTGTGLREFIKAEIVMKNEHLGVTFDQSIADAFDRSCYYMLQSVRHPELKEIVSRSFNEINEARFYKSEFLPALDNHVFLLKTISLPLKYYTISEHKLKNFDYFSISYITDGKYYYFKSRNGNNVTSNEAITMLSIMHLDIFPKRMFSRLVDACECEHEGCRTYSQKQSDLSINESVFYWPQPELETQMDKNLNPMQFPSDLSEVVSIANVSVTDITKNPETFYFAACQNMHPSYEYYQTLITEIVSPRNDGNYNRLNVDFIGQGKSIVKILQSSFGNGVKVVQGWDFSTSEDYLVAREEPSAEIQSSDEEASSGVRHVRESEDVDDLFPAIHVSADLCVDVCEFEDDAFHTLFGDD